MQMVVSALLVGATLYVSGCADQGSTSTTANTDPATRTYDRQDLSRTTRTDAAGAIQAADPSVGRGR
jgi:hypothetical protein